MSKKIFNNQTGGAVFVSPFGISSNFIKVKISTLKKIKSIIDNFDDKAIKLLNSNNSDLSYAYLHIVNFRVIAAYFIIKHTDRLLEVVTGFEISGSSYLALQQKLNMAGYLVIKLS